jgi:large subunit ribosomal protein L6
MSYRFGKQGISIPAEVSVKIRGHEITTVGPKGTLVRNFPKDLAIIHFMGSTTILERIKEEINIINIKENHTDTLYNKKNSLNKFFKNPVSCPIKISNNYDSEKFIPTREADTSITYFWPVEWITDSNPWEIYYNVSTPIAETYIKMWYTDSYLSSDIHPQVHKEFQKHPFYNVFGINQTATPDPVLGVPMLFIREGKANIIPNSHQRYQRRSEDIYEVVWFEYSPLTPYPETNLQGAKYVKSALWKYSLTRQATVIRTKVVSQFSYLYRDKASRKNKTLCSMYGLALSHLYNMVEGVSIGFKKILDITGVGYRAQLENNILILNLGFSHSVKMAIPNEISVVLEGPTRLIISGIQKEFVGEFAAKIRAACPPEPYKGKGISYEKETIRRKVGKTGK